MNLKKASSVARKIFGKNSKIVVPSSFAAQEDVAIVHLYNTENVLILYHDTDLNRTINTCTAILNERWKQKLRDGEKKRKIK